MLIVGTAKVGFSRKIIKSAGLIGANYWVRAVGGM